MMSALSSSDALKNVNLMFVSPNTLKELIMESKFHLRFD